MEGSVAEEDDGKNFSIFWTEVFVMSMLIIVMSLQLSTIFLGIQLSCNQLTTFLEAKIFESDGARSVSFL